jgi:hypothetical protein
LVCLGWGEGWQERVHGLFHWRVVDQPQLVLFLWNCHHVREGDPLTLLSLNILNHIKIRRICRYSQQIARTMSGDLK